MAVETKVKRIGGWGGVIRQHRGFKEFNVTAVAGGHSVEEGKQTQTKPNCMQPRARVSYSALERGCFGFLHALALLGTDELWADEPHGSLSLPLRHTRMPTNTRSGWPLHQRANQSGRTMANTRSVEENYMNNLTNPEENN